MVKAMVQNILFDKIHGEINGDKMDFLI